MQKSDREEPAREPKAASETVPLDPEFLHADLQRQGATVATDREPPGSGFAGISASRFYALAV
jgi:hypothetical protein